MSASRYNKCPQCAINAKELYGRVTEDEYQKAIGLSEEENLREDWEIYIAVGAVKVDYICECQACGLKHRFEYDSPLPLVQK